MENTFIKTDDKMRYTLGVVYAPDEVDSQGDFSTADEIEKACHGFMRHIQGKKSRVNKGSLGYMHKDWDDGIGDIVECFVAPVDMTIGDAEIQKGTWLMGAIWNEEIYKKIESGDITGYSMGGSGTRETVDDVPDAPSKFAAGLQEALRKYNRNVNQDGGQHD